MRREELQNSELRLQIKPIVELNLQSEIYNLKSQFCPLPLRSRKEFLEGLANCLDRVGFGRR